MSIEKTCKQLSSCVEAKDWDGSCEQCEEKPIIATTKLGPCPLCGGEATRDSMCSDDIRCRSCNFTEESGKVWSRLSALAASERRLREALERCRETFNEYADIHEDKAVGARITGGTSVEIWIWELKAVANRAMAKMCDEALKGGK